MIYLCRTYGSAVYFGLIKDSKDCEKDNLVCLRERWRWEDGTPYDYSTYHEWCQCKQSPEPQFGELCSGLISGQWYGFQCYEKHHCVCEKPISTEIKVERKSFFHEYM